MALMTVIAPFIGLDLDTEEPGPNKPAGSSGNRKKPGTAVAQTGQAGANALGQYMPIIRALKGDVEKSSIIDLSMKLGDGKNVILSASREYMTETAEQYLLAGTFSVLGKVTNVLAENEEVSLLRRTIFAVIDATGGSTSRQAFASLSSSMPGMDFSNLVITGPGLQILPLAIYV
jgi:hypothetical protein